MYQKLLGLPINASAEGGGIDQLIGWMHVLMVVLFVGWTLLFLFMLVRFRKGVHPRADHEGVKTHASSYVEGVVALLEIILLVSLSIPFWSKKVSAFPTAADKPVHVRIVAQQFAWNIHYPGPDGKFGKTDPKLVSDSNPIGLVRKGDGADDVIEINQLHLPVNRPAVLDITSKDVIHSFFLPLLRVKQDAIPGMLIPIHFTPSRTTEDIRQEMTETVTLPPRNRNLDVYIAAQDVKDKDGAVVVKKGGLLNAAAVKRIEAAGVTTLAIAPYNPTEIACAQLCGLNHYRMKGFLTIETQDQFDKWYADEVENQKEE
jgi:cytochrome c oxidase subunit II